MELIVNASSSRGNSYLLKSSKGVLVLEAGISFANAITKNDIRQEDILGMLVTHEHGDHAKYIGDYLKHGVRTYASKGTFDALSIDDHKAWSVSHLQAFTIGDFRILPFSVKHDAKEPLGYLINHEKEMGNCLFITDTYQVPFQFSGLNHLIVEANYDEEILVENLRNSKIHGKVFARVKESHMSIKVLEEMIKENDLTNVRNIVLIHLSAQNSNAKEFKEKVEKWTGKSVHIAEKGLVVNLNKTPF